MIKFFALLFIPLLFVSCGKEEPQPVTESQWKVFSYLPSDTEFLLYTNLGELRKTEHWKNFFGSEFKPGDQQSWLTEFEKETGTGLSKGISEVFTSTGWKGNNLIAVVFNDDEGVIKYLEHGKKFYPEEKNGIKLYSLKSAPDSKFYFPEKNILLIIKDKEYLSALLSKENKSLKENKKFVDIIKNIQRKNHYWFATDKGSYASLLIQKLIGTRGKAQSKKIISIINSISLSAEFSDEIKIESVIGCSDEKSAQLLSTGIRSALAMNLLSASEPMLGEILQKINIERTNSKLYLEIKIDNENILKLKNITQKRPTDKKL